MFFKVKNRIDFELSKYIQSVDKSYSLSAISPLLFKNIKDFITRDGKRVRPILFIIGYLGFAGKAAPGLYRSAISIELLHDFMLVHDDIIDKSDTRRGKPSMHRMFNQYLKNYKALKFSGEDLAIVSGDVIYAMALHAFLSIKENSRRKEEALKKIIEAVLYTGSGEFVELMSGLKNINSITKEDIYQIYDLKTANYTFASPLSIGATLAGASKKEVNKLYNYGVYLGRAFQIKDDILGLFGEEGKIGKSNLTDIKEAKKTILIWYAYKNSNTKTRLTIKQILSKRNAGGPELIKMRRIVKESGALEYAEKQINELFRKAKKMIASCKMRAEYKKSLSVYSQNVLKL